MEHAPKKTWTFTINNYTDLHIKIFDNWECSYVIYGKEVGESGTPHLQGYIIFKRAYRLAQLHKLVPEAHWEVALTTDAMNYCMKDGNFTIRDNRKQGKRNDITDFIQDISTRGLVDSIPDHAETFVKYHSGFEKYVRYTQRAAPRDAPRIFWLYGETGVGKTFIVHDICSDLWSNSGDLRWFDGYIDQREALFDDFRADHCPWSFLLRLLDRYPFKVPVKGGFAQWVPQIIFITAPYTPSQTFVSSGEDLQQLLRRLTATYLVTPDNHTEVVDGINSYLTVGHL